MKRFALLGAVVVAGVSLLSFPALAGAWDWMALPSGYALRVATDQTNGRTCHEVTLNNTFIGNDCQSGFQAALDAYVDSTICTVNPAAGGAACVPPPQPPAPAPDPVPGNGVVAAPTPPVVTPPVVTPPVDAPLVVIPAPPVGGGSAQAPPADPAPNQTATAAAATTQAVQPPIAGFKSTAIGLALTFTDDSTLDTSSSLATVTWHFGDGSNGVGGTVQHIYRKTGTFTAIEIVTDSNGLASQAAEQISVSPFNLTAPNLHKVTDVAAPKLAAAVQKATGSSVAVYCGRTPAAWANGKPAGAGEGWSIVGSLQSHIWPAGCQALKTGSGPVALGLLVLGHEAALASGTKNERSADCAALAHVPALARALGLTPAGVEATAAKIVTAKWGRGC